MPVKTPVKIRPDNSISKLTPKPEAEQKKEDLTLGRLKHELTKVYEKNIKYINAWIKFHTYPLCL